jgi:hypothetical protein
MFEAQPTRPTPNAQRNRVIPAMSAKSFIALISTLSFAALLTPSSVRAQNFPPECKSQFEQMAVGELMLLVEGCKVAFPELATDLERTIAPVSERFPACVAAYRQGAAYDRLMAMLALAGGPSVLKKHPHCTKDASDVVPKIMQEAERINRKSAVR